MYMFRLYICYLTDNNERLHQAPPNLYLSNLLPISPSIYISGGWIIQPMIQSKRWTLMLMMTWGKRRKISNRMALGRASA